MLSLNRFLLRLSILIATLSPVALPVAAAEILTLQAGTIRYLVDPATLKIDAQPDEGPVIQVMPALYSPETTAPVKDDAGWHWVSADGQSITLSPEGNALHLTIKAPNDSKLDWALPAASTGTWLIPDGEGMAFKADDAFWQSAYHHRHCLGGTTLLSFPAWSYLTQTHAVTYALGDGLQSELCLHDDKGLQASLMHEFNEGATKLDILFAIEAPDPLAPALFYRQYMKTHGQFKSFADKAVPDLPRLFGAVQAYVWGDGRDLTFLDDLKSLGIAHIVLSYDQDPNSGQPHLVGPAYPKKAYNQGYLAGPYEAFDNGQPSKTADAPSARWPDDLYPSGCIHDKAGVAKTGFANRGCYMSSAAIAGHPGPFIPASRYAAHIKDGASEVFVDVDAFGDFFHDDSPDHPMTMTQDRANRLARLGLGIHTYKLVLGSENVTAWSSPVAHYSHGTAQAHVSAFWPILGDKKRFGGWWPPEAPPLFFAPFTPTPDEARLLFGSADRLPLFEAAFHDSVVATDRWELSLSKIKGMERTRFARALLYGTPTLWNLNRKELARVGIWLKAAHDDFITAHGTDTPVALTGFHWLTDDRLVQQTSWADGRVLIANFSTIPWQGLGPDCVRVNRPDTAPVDLCPPDGL
ncbi:MAG: glycoside hydrolase [Asticcacaulis sp.]